MCVSVQVTPKPAEVQSIGRTMALVLEPYSLTVLQISNLQAVTNLPTAAELHGQMAESSGLLHRMTKLLHRSMHMLIHLGA